MYMQSLKRVILSYTQWNLIGIILLGQNNGVVIANTVFISFVTSLLVGHVGINTLTRYLNSFNSGHTFSRYDALTIHVVTHYLPLLLTGTYYTVSDAMYATCVFSIWLYVIDFQVQTIYIKSVSTSTYGTIIALSLILLVMFAHKK
jgi:hypothetical protein